MLAVAESGVEDANVVGVRDAIGDVIRAAAGGKCGCGSGSGVWWGLMGRNREWETEIQSGSEGEWTEMRDRNKRWETEMREWEIKYYYFFFYNTATVQFYLYNCTVTVLQKNLQYLPLQFSDADDFKAANAKFPLNIALAFSNANALMYIFVSFDM